MVGQIVVGPVRRAGAKRRTDRHTHTHANEEVSDIRPVVFSENGVSCNVTHIASSPCQDKQTHTQAHTIKR